MYCQASIDKKSCRNRLRPARFKWTETDTLPMTWLHYPQMSCNVPEICVKIAVNKEAMRFRREHHPPRFTTTVVARELYGRSKAGVTLRDDPSTSSRSHSVTIRSASSNPSSAGQRPAAADCPQAGACRPPVIGHQYPGKATHILTYCRRLAGETRGLYCGDRGISIPAGRRY